MSLELIVAAAAIPISYVITRIDEHFHYKSIRKREAELLECPFVNFDCEFSPENSDFTSKIVEGSVVLGSGYFKKVVAQLKNIFGGSVTSYESILDRARREATLRMREQARGSDGVMNVRVQTASLEKGVIEVSVYATAIYYQKPVKNA